jgi:hypothetical protein
MGSLAPGVSRKRHYSAFALHRIYHDVRYCCPLTTRPSIHQMPALLEKVTTPVRSFQLVANDVRQGRLSGLPRLVYAAAQLRNLAPEIMHGQIG